MERIEFNSIKELVERFNDTYETVKKEYDEEAVSIIAKYNDAIEIIREIMSEYDYAIGSIEIDNEDFEEYTDEYIISLDSAFEPERMFCEPLKRDFGYIWCDSKVVFVLDDCNSKCLERIRDGIAVEVGIVDDEDKTETDLDDYTMDSTYVSRDEDGKPIGFSRSWVTTENNVICHSSYSHYTDDLDMLKKVAKEFGVDI